MQNIKFEIDFESYLSKVIGIIVVINMTIIYLVVVCSVVFYTQGLKCEG